VRVLEALSATARLAHLVRERARFFTNALTRREAPARYHLRESGLAVYLRHGTTDVNTFEQIFRLGHYALPSEVEGALERAPGPWRVVDLGANAGFFGAFILGRHPDASVVAYEPSPENLEVLRLTVDANPELDWTIVGAAAGVEDGEVSFQSGLFTNSYVAPVGGAGTISVPSVDVFRSLGAVDLLKIDIEGSEWPILADPRFRSVPGVVALEYHPHLCPGEDPHAEAKRLLRESGLMTLESEFEALPGHGMLWAWPGGPD